MIEKPVSFRILADIENVGARHAVVGVECNFTGPLVDEIRRGEKSLAQAADEVLRQASWYASAGGSLSRLGGRLRAHANRQAALKGEVG